MSSNSGASDAPSLKIFSKTQPHVFVIPLKKINEGQDVSAFLVSKGYFDIMTFLFQLNRAMFPLYVEDISTSGQKQILNWDLDCQNVKFSETVNRLKRLLEELDRIIDEVPPDPGPRRFGNASFRKWYQAVEERTSDLLNSHLPYSTLQYPHQSNVTAAAELSSYFLGSFGSPQRLDYGSGHELSFLAFLGCIWKLGGFGSPDESCPPGNRERAVVLGLIVPYLSLIRRLILTYTLEPAGSHGVWGLDDHSFIPYILGSAQYGPALSRTDASTPTEGSHPQAPDPADVAKTAAVERHRRRNLYFGAIGFIHDVKKGPFWEHSPMLYDISGVRAGWGKINKGMLKMYDAEVLSKFPVVQHFSFGSLFSFDRDPDAAPPPASVHAANQPVSEKLASSSSSALTAAEKIAPPRSAPGTQHGPPWANRATINVPGGEMNTAAPWANKTPNHPPPFGTTAAPWANRPSTMRDPGEDAAAPKVTAPSSSSATTAPWASQPKTTTPTKFSHQPSSRKEAGEASRWTISQQAAAGNDPVAATPAITTPTSTTNSTEQSMPPPPTRAPWAKPP